MDGAFNIPDPTDWLNTPLKDFSTLENALHCQICKEFYDTPMITSCSHTFCSKCIRTSLSTDGKCPACRASDQASRLRNNWLLQEVVATFLAARPAALEVAQKAQEAITEPKARGKRKRAVLDSDDVAQAEEERRTTRSKSRRLAASQTSEPETTEIGDSDGDGDGDLVPEEPPNDGLVECLLGCGKRMKAEEMDPHLDRCEDEKNEQRQIKSRTPVHAWNIPRPPSAQNTKPQDRISELNYSLLNPTKLTARLKEAGIPNWGSKQLMIKRHTEWVNLWNANCDSNHPRSKRELLQELDTWERTQGGRAPNVNGLTSTVMRKEFDGVGWANKNKDDFSRLIAEARRKKHNPALEAGERAKDVAVAGDGSEHADIEKMDAGQLSAGLRLLAEQAESANPYENNPEAISSIREKVEAANAGQHIEPVMNSGFEGHGRPVTADSVPTPNKSSQNHAGSEYPERNHIGLHRESSMQEHLAADNAATPASVWDTPASQKRSPAKKVPMFAVPQAPVTDVDGGNVGQ